MASPPSLVQNDKKLQERFKKTLVRDFISPTRSTFTQGQIEKEYPVQPVASSHGRGVTFPASLSVTG